MTCFKLLQGRVDNFLGTLERVDAGLNDNGTGARLAEGGCDGFGALGSGVGDVVYDNACAVTGEGEGDTCANAVFTAGAGDDGNLALERESINGHG